MGKVKENKGYSPREGRGQAILKLQIGSLVQVSYLGLFENYVPAFSTDVELSSRIVSPFQRCLRIFQDNAISRNIEFVLGSQDLRDVFVILPPFSSLSWASGLES
ncbi:MAG: hypothetical protein JRN20_09910 [Nitrososphaerota archaeon]|nr:hypothetical protein [Nitrososphaerota archaeon]